MSRLIAAIAMALTYTAALAQPETWRAEWPNTDFSRSAQYFSEIVSGGPPKDGIPAIDAPQFRPAREESRLEPREQVISYDHPDAPVRAYPIRYLMWHEIVNDVVAGLPVAVTYCPLCNSGMVFDARIAGAPHTFGVSGKLRHSDMVMYDRQTESWWQQAIGEAGLVMDEPDWRRAYGRNPYVGYDSLRRPFLYSGEDPPHGIPPLTRVVRVGDRA